MRPKEFSDALRSLTLTALNGGQMDPTQVIGQLEIAKLNVDRICCERAARAETNGVVPVILRPPVSDI
jgi:hypothetical protein